MFGKMPKDAYGNEYELGGYILSPKYGIARVVGVAVGEDGSACVVGSYAQPDLDDPYPGKPAKMAHVAVPREEQHSGGTRRRATRYHV